MLKSQGSAALASKPKAAVLQLKAVLEGMQIHNFLPIKSWWSFRNAFY